MGSGRGEGEIRGIGKRINAFVLVIMSVCFEGHVQKIGFHSATWYDVTGMTVHQESMAQQGFGYPGP
jgi:hypothetical protein